MVSEDLQEDSGGPSAVDGIVSALVTPLGYDYLLGGGEVLAPLRDLKMCLRRNGNRLNKAIIIKIPAMMDRRSRVRGT
jgi:hypothetical protein